MNFGLYCIYLWFDGDSTVIGLVKKCGDVTDVANELERERGREEGEGREREKRRGEGRREKKKLIHVEITSSVMQSNMGSSALTGSMS